MIVIFRKQKKLEALQVKLTEHFEAEKQEKSFGRTCKVRINLKITTYSKKRNEVFTFGL